VPAFGARLPDTVMDGRGGGDFDKAAVTVDDCAGVRLHDLRHTCASLAIRSGANVKVVNDCSDTRRRC
jgi:integrase